MRPPAFRGEAAALAGAGRSAVIREHGEPPLKPEEPAQSSPSEGFNQGGLGPAAAHPGSTSLQIQGSGEGAPVLIQRPFVPRPQGPGDGRGRQWASPSARTPSSEAALAQKGSREGTGVPRAHGIPTPSPACRQGRRAHLCLGPRKLRIYALFFQNTHLPNR